MIWFEAKDHVNCPKRTTLQTLWGGGLDEKKAEWKAINERLNMNFNSFFIMIDSNIKTAVLLAEMLYANA